MLCWPLYFTLLKAKIFKTLNYNYIKEVITTVISLTDLPDLQLLLLYLEIIWLLGEVLNVKKLAKHETYLSHNHFYETIKLYKLYYF